MTESRHRWRCLALLRWLSGCRHARCASLACALRPRIAAAMPCCSCGRHDYLLLLMLIPRSVVCIGQTVVFQNSYRSRQTGSIEDWHTTLHT
jgi:hypothetical protein